MARISLIPQNRAFYVLYGKAARNTVAIAEKLVDLLDGFPEETDDVFRDIRDLEHEGDRLTHEVVDQLNRTFVTPFDRDDIYMLATEIDDIVDYLEEASDLLGLYGVEMPTRHAVEQCGIIVRACEQLATACENLKGMRGVQDALVQVKAYEDEGDRVLRDALAALFRDEGIDPLIVIRWKDIYEALERALDACETAANVIANILVKN